MNQKYNATLKVLKIRGIREPAKETLAVISELSDEQLGLSPAEIASEAEAVENHHTFRRNLKVGSSRAAKNLSESLARWADKLNQ